MDSGQQAAFLGYEALISQVPDGSGGMTTEQFDAMSLPQRLDYMADHIADDATKLRTRADAARHFYEVLSVDQRAQFDAATAPPVSHAAVAPDETPLAASAAKNYSLPSHTDPGWLVKPTADNISRVYPVDAQRHHIKGNVVLTFRVDTDGYLADCVVNQETPQGAGFGNAALEITAYMRMQPATNYGVPVESAVTVPIGFQF